MKGLYIHIPFCSSKCKYCDFYSVAPKENQMDSYLTAVLSALHKNKTEGMFDTIYFGGGTPSFFGGKRISKIIKEAFNCFSFAEDTEITVECNPSSVDEELVKDLALSGVNRISMGVQSAIDAERNLLGRKSDSDEVRKALKLFEKYSISNISLDLMLGIPSQTRKSLDRSLDFIISSGCKHISIYMLKIEENTPLYKEQHSLSFPDEDTVCDMYLHCVNRLHNYGYLQYEISNFAVPGFESRHNTKYWKCEEYLGIGPSAHSFLNSKRFYYPRSLTDFIKVNDMIFECDGGDREEFVMLSLRLSEGLSFEEYEKRFSEKISDAVKEKCRFFEKKGLVKLTDESFSLTPEGFLLSNSIISEILSILT